MRKILAVVACIMATPSMAQEAPALVQRAIKALVAAHYVTDECPSYEVNIAGIAGAVEASGLTTEDMTGRYASLVSKIHQDMSKHDGMSNDQFCHYLFDYYNSADPDSHFIAKR